MAAATSAGPATSRTLLLIGELKVVPPQPSSRMILIVLQLRLTCTTSNVRCRLAVHNQIKKSQETLEMFEFKARKKRNGNTTN